MGLKNILVLLRYTDTPTLPVQLSPKHNHIKTSKIPHGAQTWKCNHNICANSIKLNLDKLSFRIPSMLMLKHIPMLAHSQPINAGNRERYNNAIYSLRNIFSRETSPTICHYVCVCMCCWVKNTLTMQRKNIRWHMEFHKNDKIRQNDSATLLAIIPSAFSSASRAKAKRICLLMQFLYLNRMSEDKSRGSVITSAFITICGELPLQCIYSIHLFIIFTFLLHVADFSRV